MNMTENKVQKICNCISTLTNEINIGDSSNISEPRNIKEAFSFELKRNVHFTFQKIKSYPTIQLFVCEYIEPCLGESCDSCDYLKFLQLCLVLLRLLKVALTEEGELDPKDYISSVPVPKGLLSISQQSTLQKCLQFAVALGILPNLLRGIGIPLSKRLKHAIILEHFTSESTLYQKHIQIAVCLDTLMGCLECEAMQSTILTYFGTDILAALLQLCHAPIKKIDKIVEPATDSAGTGKINFKSMLSATKDTSFNDEIQIVNMMQAHRKYFIPHLEAFIKQICPSLLMWELLLLLGYPIKSETPEMGTAKAPLWLKKICGQMLTDLILQNHGIADLVQVVLDKAHDGDISCGNVDNVKMDAVAKIISYNQVRHISVEEYIQRLSNQVFQLLHLKGTQMDNLLKYIASCIILQLCDRDMESAEQFFLVKLLRPLWCCVRQPTNPNIKVVVKESEMSTCIEDLYTIFVSCTSPYSRKFLDVLYPFSHCLCSMFFFLLKGESYLKSKVHELIKVILKNTSDEKALSLLQSVSFSNNKDCGVYLTNVDFANGDLGGIVTLSKSEEEYPDEIVRYRAILDLLSELQNKNLNRSFILLVLKEFCTFHLESKQNSADPENVKAGILFNALLQELSEWNVDIGEALMSNISEVIDILMTLLESICNCRSDENFHEKTLWVVLMILNSILESDEQLTSTDWDSLKQCVPSLQKLQKSEIDSDLKEIIFSIIIHIATHGAACKNNLEMMKHFMSNLPEHSNFNMSEDMIADLTDLSLDKDSYDNQPTKSKSSVTNSAHIPSTSKHQSKSKEKNVPKRNKKSDSSGPAEESPSTKKLPAFELALKHIKNSEVAIKGHGLISLGKLISKRDSELVNNKVEVMKILQECIEHGDTYVYLSAIQNMVLLSDVDVDFVLPTVLSLYQKNEAGHEVTLKYGEVLLKISNSLGDMIHKYKDQLLHAFLIVTKHEDPHIRSSSLSNLGQICMHLKFSISGPWLQEILMCVISFLKTDKDLEVRRCAVMVIYLLLKGVGKDLIKVLENDLRDIYTQLKIIETREKDDCLRGHSRKALEEINEIMKELLYAKAPLTKEIRILQ